jgi:GDP-L-fucose synthase|tara:strand:+ start:207 stop:1157 length:951 start_codon:yes stop_codon:yes gene_type:complete
MNTESKIYVAGNTGLVGSAIVRMLHWKGYTNILSSPSSHWDLRRQEDVERFFRINEPEYVYLAAAKVGGICANKDYPGHFIYDNLMIQSNIINAARKFGVKKLLFLGSSCIYPKMCEQPIKEEYFMTGPLEPTNDAYAIAKIAGVKMCQAYRKQYGFNAISLMPTNLYGPNDNFDLETSHVLPAMIAKYHHATTDGYTVDMGGPWWPDVNLWGDGSARREFLHVDDLAEACYTCMKDYDSPEIINVGTGEDITIRELSEIISKVTKFPGFTNWDTTKPNGTPRKLLDVTKIKSLGWEPKIDLKEGIKSTYEWYKDR